MRFALYSALAALAISAAYAATDCSDLTSGPSAEGSVPDAIKVSSGEGKFYLRLFATGTQNYKCTIDGSTKTWTLVEPKASLSLRQGGPGIGDHFFENGKPAWQIRNKKCGKVITQKVASSPSPSAKNIPWLKTKTDSVSGSGPLLDTKFVDRVRTKGGAAPDASACTKDGQTSNVQYDAEYLLYK